MSADERTAEWPTKHDEVRYGTSTEHQRMTWLRTMADARRSANPTEARAALAADSIGGHSMNNNLGWRDGLRLNGLLTSEQSDAMLTLAFSVARECEWVEFLYRRGDLGMMTGFGNAWEQALARHGLHPLARAQ